MNSRVDTGYSSDSIRIREILERCRQSTSITIIQFLSGLSGTSLRIPDRHDIWSTDLNIGVWKGLEELVSQNSYHWDTISALIGNRVAIVGDMDNETFDLLLTEIGEAYRVCDQQIWYAGSTGLEAIENFCMRSVLPRVPCPGKPLVFLPPGCPNARRLATNAMVQFGEVIDNDPVASPLTTRLEVATPSEAVWIEKTPSVDDVSRAGVVMHRPALQFLEEYSGIRVVHRNPYLPHYVSWGYLGLCHRSLCGGTPEHQRRLLRRREQWDWPVIVGMIDDFNLELSVNEKGEVLLSQLYQPTWRLGSSPEAAIDTLLNHKAWEPIPITATF